MGKNKITLASNVQLKQVLLLHASVRMTEASQPLAVEKGSKGPSQPVMLKPIAQVPLADSLPVTESSEGSRQLVHRKRRRLGKCRLPRLLIFIQDSL